MRPLLARTHLGIGSRTSAPVTVTARRTISLAATRAVHHHGHATLAP